VPSKEDIMDKIVAAFKAAGMELEHFRPSGEFREMWQFDGGCGGPLVQLYTGINGLHQPGIFGHYDDGKGNSWDLSCCKVNWMEEFGKYIPNMAMGWKLPF